MQWIALCCSVIQYSEFQFSSGMCTALHLRALHYNTHTDLHQSALGSSCPLLKNILLVTCKNILPKKSRIQETLNLSTDADRSTNTERSMQGHSAVQCIGREIRCLPYAGFFLEFSKIIRYFRFCLDSIVFVGNYLDFSKLLRLIFKVTKVTTEHKKWP